MGLKLYRSTGAAITLARRLLGLEIRVTGAEHLDADRPTLYVANHFTRFETFVLPYVLFHQIHRQVHSLATHAVFKGIFKKYWKAMGVTSVRDPLRNRKIVRELATASSGWVIYPEGGLIKNKKTVHQGRLRLEKPTHNGPPHTGAALLALRSEIVKRRYRDAWARGDADRITHYRERYGLGPPETLADTSTVIVPVSITYHAVRPGPNPLHRLARLLFRDMDPRIAEEMQVEGGILFGRSEMSVHFGEPIPVADHLDRTRETLRDLLAKSESKAEGMLLRRQAGRLTRTAMRAVYHGIEIGLEHLFCYGLRAVPGEVVDRRCFHRALYLAAMELRGRDDVRLHPGLRNGIAALLTDETYAPLRDVVDLARREGVLDVENGSYRIRRDRLTEPMDFHDVRLKRMVQVVANELEPIDPAVAAVRRAVGLDERSLCTRVRIEMDSDRCAMFRDEYRLWSRPGESKAETIGAPFLLEGRRRGPSIVLTHGYLAGPAQMRPLAEALHARGWTVCGVRLPGHGTAPEHLTRVTWHDWRRAVVQAYVMARQHSGPVVLGGFSLGGALSLLAASDPAIEPDAVFTVNACLRLCDRRARLVPAVRPWLAALGRVGVGTGHGRLRNASECPDTNYPSYSLTDLRQLQHTIRACRRSLPAVTAPALVIQATHDPVVHPTSGRAVHAGLGSTERRLVEPALDRHVIVRGPGSEAIFDRIAGFIEQATGVRG